MKKKYRIKSRFRFCMSIVVVFIFLLCAVGAIFGYDQAASMTKPLYTEIMVVQGDTLWDLAKAYGPGNQDLRRIVHRICRVNDITADELRSGQKILIPNYL